MAFSVEISGSKENFSSLEDYQKFIQILKGKRVVFISTKNADYSRNTQELRLIETYAQTCTQIVFDDKNYLLRILKAYVHSVSLLFKKDFDVVFLGFSPQLLFPLLPFFKKKYTVFLDFFISVYDTFVWDRRKIKDKSVLARFMYWVDKTTFQFADFFLADTKAHLDYFVEALCADRKKGIVLYIQADQSVYSPRNVEKPQELKDAFIVMFYGSILPLHGVDIIIKSMKLLEHYEDIRCFIIGGKLNKNLQELYKQTKNITLIDWIPHDELVNYISFSDLNLIGHFSKESSKAFRTIPGKAYVAQAMGKPMVLGNSPANHELFEAGPNCWFVQMGDEAALSRCIETIYIKERNLQV